MSNVEQQLLSVAWRELDVRELIRLCKTNKQFSNICRDPNTWKYLLKRDFNIDNVGNDALSLYVKSFLMQKLLYIIIFINNEQYVK